jgi:metal-responsive CopG/Arc/MetJ family transcriptional regulator
MEKRETRIQLVMAPSEIDALDEWRAKHKIWSRSEAIRRLIAEGVKRGE